MPETKYIFAGVILLIGVGQWLWSNRDLFSGLKLWGGDGRVSDATAIEAAKTLARYHKQNLRTVEASAMFEVAADIFRKSLS